MRLLLLLQLLQVAFLWLHDWVPLPPLNDVAAVRRQDSLARLIRVTIIQSLPFTIGFVASLAAYEAGHALPGWVRTWLWVSYSLLFLGEITAWWLPYLWRADPARVARYRTMFGQTHSFLPERNGIKPNTLHCALHAMTAATLILLAARAGFPG